MKLNLGAGDWQIPGFVAVDRKFGTEVFPLPHADNSIEEIRASHVMEHFSHRYTLAVLAEWVRVLMPGGLLRVAVPNFDYACGHFEDPLAEGWIMGGHTDGNDIHGAIFTPAKLWAQLEAVGLKCIEPWTSEIQDCASLPVSLNLQGRKP